MKTILALTAAVVTVSPTLVGAQGFYRANTSSHSALRHEQPTLRGAIAQEPDRAPSDGLSFYFDDAGNRHEVENSYAAALDRGYALGSAAHDQKPQSFMDLRERAQIGDREIAARPACGDWAWEPVIGRGGAC
jgi:hypothetical protein